ncbi:hypothetical protein [Streptomyces sp. enrichment culture]|uniref:hypothetical protein n=1 Tax=Streptomyces sp. enrichment culture TaxID=1795815 RepID=UPI003F569AC1
MKTRLGAFAFFLPFTLMTVTGCAMSNAENDDVPLAGTRTSKAAADEAERVSSEIYDLLGIKGKASETRPGVTECGNRDRATHFQIFHPWTFYPASPEALGDVMEHLKAELPKHGWKVVEYGPDTSRNRNLNLTADHDTKRFGVNIVYYAKDKRPHLGIHVVSGCYQTPDGEEVQRF